MSVIDLYASAPLGVNSVLGRTVGGVGDLQGAAAYLGFNGSADLVPEAGMQYLRSTVKFGMAGVGTLIVQAVVAYALAVADQYGTYITSVAAYNDGLEIQDGMLATLTVSDSVMDALMMVDGVSAQYTIAALVQSGLLLGSGSSNASAAATQYAVNVLTSALGTYEGFEFKAFAATGTTVYGLRADGVYLVRAGDDNGAPVTVTVDFGSDAFGSQHAKHVNAVFFGIATDGQVFAKLTADDGVERVYRVTQRGSSARAVTSQRVTGRLWNLTLEVADATDFSLDTVELFVAASTRRWVR
jgi:hypothetical protein